MLMPPPEDDVNTMVLPPEVIWLLLTSLAVSVSPTEDPDVKVAGDPVMVTAEFANDIVPGVTVIVGRVVVTGLPPIVALIVVAEPETTPVNIAV